MSHCKFYGSLFRHGIARLGVIVSDFDQLSSTDIDLLQTVIGDPNYPALNVSEAWNPFNYGTDSGSLALVKEFPASRLPPSVLLEIMSIQMRPSNMHHNGLL